jgi:hypothetical protein
MDFDKREIAVLVLLLVLLFIFWRKVSTYTDTTFSVSMPLSEAEKLYSQASDAISTEMSKKLEDAQATNNFALIKKAGDEGHEALMKLQDAYQKYIKAKGGS